MRRTRTRSKTTSRPEGWAQIDARCKPSKATAQDNFRPVLKHGCITHEKEGSFLSTTDSYILVRLPITLDSKTIKDREKELPSGPIIPEALKALDRSRTGYFRIKDGNVEVYGEPMLYPLPKDLTEFPKTHELVPNGKPAKDDGVAEIGINPMLVRRVAEAMGANGTGMRMYFYSPLKPVRIEALGIEGVGVVMPIRLT